MRYAKEIFKAVAEQSGCMEGVSLQRQYQTGPTLFHPDKDANKDCPKALLRFVQQAFQFFITASQIIREDENASQDSAYHSGDDAGGVNSASLQLCASTDANHPPDSSMADASTKRVAAALLMM